MISKHGLLELRKLLKTKDYGSLRRHKMCNTSNSKASKYKKFNLIEMKEYINKLLNFLKNSMRLICHDDFLTDQLVQYKLHISLAKTYLVTFIKKKGYQIFFPMIHLYTLDPYNDPFIHNTLLFNFTDRKGYVSERTCPISQ